MTVCSKGRVMPGKTWKDSVVEGFAAATKKETFSSYSRGVEFLILKERKDLMLQQVKYRWSDG